MIKSFLRKVIILFMAFYWCSMFIGYSRNDYPGTIAHTQSAAKSVVLNRLVLKAVSLMPGGGGYAVDRTAMLALVDAVRWDEKNGRLRLYPAKAKPSFCSSACYLVLMEALQLWEKENRLRFSPGFWQYMHCRYGQADGDKGWGRINGNGPALAKWVHELGAGVNFTDIKKAAPGDFLKIFWTNEIGQREYGHLVVFLGADFNVPEPVFTFWSSNMNDGYGKKTIPLSQAKRLVFTRVTNVPMFNAYHRLPEKDEWVSSLLRKSVTLEEVKRKCGIR